MRGTRIAGGSSGAAESATEHLSVTCFSGSDPPMPPLIPRDLSGQSGDEGGFECGRLEGSDEMTSSQGNTALKLADLLRGLVP